MSNFYGRISSLDFMIYLCGNFAHVFYLAMSTKGCSGFFSFCLDVELLIKLDFVTVKKSGAFFDFGK